MFISCLIKLQETGWPQELNWTDLSSPNKHTVTTKTPCRVAKSLTVPHLYFTFSSWSMFACNLANQAKNCNINWHCIERMHPFCSIPVLVLTISGCSALSNVSHLLCCLDPVILHIQHLETFQQDVLRWSRHRRREGGLQGPRRQAAQILNGQLQISRALCF